MFPSVCVPGIVRSRTMTNLIRQDDESPPPGTTHYRYDVAQPPACSKECHCASDYAADEVQSVLKHPAELNGRTAAVLETSGGDIVGGGVRDLSPAQRRGIEAGRNRLETPSRTCRNHCLAGSRSTWAQAQSDRNFEGFLPRLYKGTGGSWSDDHRPANSRLEIMTEVPRG